MKFKKVEVEYDQEGNAIVNPIEKEGEPKPEPKPEPIKLEDEQVVNYLKGKFNKEEVVLEDLFKEKDKPAELSERMQKLLKYQEDTGRSIEDYVLLNKDYDSVSDDELMSGFLKTTKKHLSNKEIVFEIKNKFSFDEELDSEDEIQAKKIAKKDFIQEAKGFFNDMKDKYSAPAVSVDKDASKELSTFKENQRLYNESAKKAQSLAKNQRDVFLEKTNEVFNDKFEGFKFKISDDKSQVYKPSDINKVKESNLDIGTLLDKFVDDKGLMNDAEGYHRALSIASNPDEFAKFFYEQGIADSVDDMSKDSKNRNFNARGVHTPTDKKKKFKDVSSAKSTKGIIKLKHY